MVNFSIARKGYNIKQVDDYCTKIINFTENKLKEQKKRINLLKEENVKLYKRIKDYENQEKMVSEALINATKKANEIITASRMRFALEGERIKIFKSKWTNYVKEASMKVYKLDEKINMQAYLTKMDDELRAMLGVDLNIHKTRVLNQAEEQFMEERKRLNTMDDDNIINDITDSVLEDETNADKDRDYINKVKETLNRNIKKEVENYPLNNEEKNLENDDDNELLNELSDEFDMEEAINPKKSLEEICRELGLNVND